MKAIQARRLTSPLGNARANSIPLARARADCGNRPMKGSSVLWRQEQGKYRDGEKRRRLKFATRCAVNTINQKIENIRQSEKTLDFFPSPCHKHDSRGKSVTVSVFDPREGKGGKAGAVC